MSTKRYKKCFDESTRELSENKKDFLLFTFISSYTTCLFLASFLFYYYYYYYRHIVVCMSGPVPSICWVTIQLCHYSVYFFCG